MANAYLKSFTEQKYEAGFVTDVETEILEAGLNENIIRQISQKKGEPDWLLQFRLTAYRHWLTLPCPDWALVRLPEIDYQAIHYYADPTKKKNEKKEIDPELMKTFEKLGIPLEERMALAGVAVDAVMDSVSVKTTFKERLQEKGIIFSSFSEAVRENPELVRKYLGMVVPYTDNYFAALNSAVFSDGSFVYIPKGVRCPMELSTYFRINARNTGQFERTLIVCEDGGYVSYLEGCTAPMRDENQLHAAIVEIVVGEEAEVKYSTVQNWYPGDAEGKGGVLNLVTKRGLVRGRNGPLVHSQRRGRAGRILLGGRDKQLPRSGHRHEDDSLSAQHQLDNHLERHLGRQESEHLPRTSAHVFASSRRAQLLFVRFAPARFGMWRAHLPLHRRGQRRQRGRTRSHDLENLGRPAPLLPPARYSDGRCRESHRGRLCARRDQQTSDGICRRSTEIARRFARRQRRLTAAKGRYIIYIPTPTQN